MACPAAKQYASASHVCRRAGLQVRRMWGLQCGNTRMQAVFTYLRSSCLPHMSFLPHMKGEAPKEGNKAMYGSRCRDSSESAPAGL